MPGIKYADKTIFTLRDEGDSSVGLEPTEMTLTYNYEVDQDAFAEILELLYTLSNTDWHGKITAYVEYQERQSGQDVTELKLQIEGYHPDFKPELTVRII